MKAHCKLIVDNVDKLIVAQCRYASYKAFKN